MDQQVNVYTLIEVASLLRVSSRTIYNMIRDGRLHPVRVGRGKYLFPRSEVDRLLKP